jgi:hypothetical protein
MKDKITQLNSNGFEIFKNTLKRKALEALNNGEGIGQYELN